MLQITTLQVVASFQLIMSQILGLNWPYWHLLPSNSPWGSWVLGNANFGAIWHTKLIQTIENWWLEQNTSVEFATLLSLYTGIIRLESDHSLSCHPRCDVLCVLCQLWLTAHDKDVNIVQHQQQAHNHPTQIMLQAKQTFIPLSSCHQCLSPLASLMLSVDLLMLMWDRFSAFHLAHIWQLFL